MGVERHDCGGGTGEYVGSGKGKGNSVSEFELLRDGSSSVA